MYLCLYVGEEDNFITATTCYPCAVISEKELTPTVTAASQACFVTHPLGFVKENFTDLIHFKQLFSQKYLNIDNIFTLVPDTSVTGCEKRQFSG